MERIKEKHENPIIERVSDSLGSLGVHQPENATETNKLASVAYLASWREIDKETFEEKELEEEKQEWYEVSEVPARLEYLRENAEGCGYSISDCRVSLAEYSKREQSEENISRIGACVLFIRENEKFYYSTVEEARDVLLEIFREHRIPLPNEIQYVIGGYYVKWNLVQGFSRSELLLWKWVQRTLKDKLATEFRHRLN